MRNELQVAVEYLEHQLELVRRYAEGFPDKDNYTAIADIYTAALDTTLSALRDAQARQEGCEYCEDGFECDTNHFHTRPDWMLLNDINDCIPAHYCPNCGRHLASDQAKEGGE